MKLSDKINAVAIVVISAVVFFVAALSSESSVLKAGVILSDLIFSGLLLQGILKCEGWYGLLLVRGKNGLKFMKQLGEGHPRAARELTEFGLSFGFGVPYSLYIQGKANWGKVAVHALGLSLFYLWLQSMPAASSWLNSWSLPIGLLFGLASIGFLAIVFSAANIFVTKTALSGVAPVVPGITLPFWEGLIAIAIVAIVHEVAHGVLAAAEKVPVRSSGILLFGFLPVGAFVEPDEAKFKRAELWKKRRVLVAGSTSNFVFFLLFIVLAFGAGIGQQMASEGVVITGVPSNSSAFGLIAPGQMIQTLNDVEVRNLNDFYFAAAKSATSGELVVKSSGETKNVPLYAVSVSSVVAGSPSDGVLQVGELVTNFDGKPVFSVNDIRNVVDAKAPGDSVWITAGAVAREIKLNSEKKMGVVLSQSLAFSVDNKPYPGWSWLYALLSFIASVLGLTAVLNFALSVVNLMPVFVTDGHRIFFEEFKAAFGKGAASERKALLAANLIGFAVLLVLLINLGRWFKVI